LQVQKRKRRKRHAETTEPSGKSGLRGSIFPAKPLRPACTSGPRRAPWSRRHGPSASTVRAPRPYRPVR
jgi:hypothetical protein